MSSLVSIIMPSYNSEEFLDTAVQSVINQSYSDWELLIMDDRSTDESFKIAQNYSESDDRIKCFKMESNDGPAKARNFGIEKANGRYISFLDSDDRWDSTFLEELLGFMNDRKISFAFSSYRQMNEDLSKCYSVFHVPEKVSFYDILKSNPISALTMIYDIKILGKEYMEDISREDVSLWLKLLGKTEYAWGFDKDLADYRIRNNSRSRNKLKITLQQWMVYRGFLKYGFIKSLYYLSFWILRSIKKYFFVSLSK